MLVLPSEHYFESLYQTCQINVITYFLPRVVMLGLFIEIVGYVVYVVPEIKVDTVIFFLPPTVSPCISFH